MDWCSSGLAILPTPRVKASSPSLPSPFHQGVLSDTYLNCSHTQGLSELLHSQLLHSRCLRPTLFYGDIHPHSSHPPPLLQQPFRVSLTLSHSLPYQNPSFTWLQKSSIIDISRALPDEECKVASYCQMKATLVYMDFLALQKFKLFPPEMVKSMSQGNKEKACIPLGQEHLRPPELHVP